MIEQLGHDGFVVTGQHLRLAQLVAWRAALQLECHGMTRHGRPVYDIVQEYLHITGTREQVLAQLDEHIRQVRA